MDRETQVAKRIREVREKQGWTQERLATESNLTSRTIVNVESGKGINLGTLAKIADALNCPIAELLN